MLDLANVVTYATFVLIASPIIILTVTKWVFN